jgi:hypothetical protein
VTSRHQIKEIAEEDCIRVGLDALKLLSGMEAEEAKRYKPFFGYFPESKLRSSIKRNNEWGTIIFGGGLKARQ